nr:hypothetical protein [Paenibacillus ginsengarvi]
MQNLESLLFSYMHNFLGKPRFPDTGFPHNGNNSSFAIGKIGYDGGNLVNVLLPLDHLRLF